MSVYYIVSKEFTADRLFDGSLDVKFGVREKIVREEVLPKTTETMRHRWLTDGHNYLQVSIDRETGLVGLLIQYSCRFNDPEKILNAIADEFDADIFSEYEPQFRHLRDERTYAD